MSLKERVYSVLVVSAAEKMNNALSSVLPEYRYEPVQVVSGINAAKRAFSERAYDLVIINSPLPDDPGLRFAIDVSQSGGAVVLVLVRAELHHDVREKVVGYGVFTLARPMSLPLLALALEWMESARERLRRTEKKTLSVEEKMEEIRLVNRAKWLLIAQGSMDEPQAHRFIEKQAMDRCIPRREVAEEIIKKYAAT